LNAFLRGIAMRTIIEANDRRHPRVPHTISF
jgi:hypothetical protein